MLKLPSLYKLKEKAAHVIQRFPLVLLSAFIAVISVNFLIYIQNFEDVSRAQEILSKLALTASLGIALFFAFALYSESKAHNIKQKVAMQLSGIALLLLYYFTLDNISSFGYSYISRYLLFSIGLHMFVAFAPFIRNLGIQAFWQFNKSLFLRFHTSVLYSIVLYTGLSIAIFSVNLLFEVHVNENTYFYLYFCIIGIFNTWFFLSGVPSDFDALEKDNSYPTALKVFTQFVLLPLIVIYMLILYVYMGKILIEWSLPKGYVSTLIIIFSVLGILSLLLIHPIRSKRENSWINQFSRQFYVTLFPLIALLFVAIGKRISDYGITESRYFILILACWLLAIATYFVFSKKKNIKLIPVSLCILAFISAAGPLSASKVSERSQLNRLENKLIEAKIIENGKVSTDESLNPDKEVLNEIQSIIRYINSHHDLAKLQPMIAADLDSAFKDINHYSRPQVLYQLLGISIYFSYEETEASHFNFQSERHVHGKRISGFDYFQTFNKSYGNSKTELCLIDTDAGVFQLQFKKHSNQLMILHHDTVLTSYSMNDMINSLSKLEIADNSVLDEKLMSLDFKDEKIHIKLVFSSIRGLRENKEEMNISFLNGWILIGIKE